jgi:zinc transport system substrate-binding protein
MKRIILLIFACLLLASSVYGCTQAGIPQEPVAAAPEATPEPTSEPTPEPVRETLPEQTPELAPEPVITGKNLSITATIFPQYDWVYQILGEKAQFKEISLIINNRIDLHSFQPSVSDIAKISTSDLFIYVGGESDVWAEAVLEQAVNPDMVVINLLQLLGDDALINEDIDDGHHHHHHHHHDDEFDEHVWLSLRNAVIFTNAIAEALSALDPELSETYKENAAKLVERLVSLDLEYKQVVSNASGDTLIFADRFPFRYLLNDYGINFYAAFSGCSAETEASFRTITFLARKLDELRLTSVMVTESADKSIAETIISSSTDKNQQILVLDSMQSSNDVDRQQGVTFISIMESNLEVLKAALT